MPEVTVGKLPRSWRIRPEEAEVIFGKWDWNPKSDDKKRKCSIALFVRGEIQKTKSSMHQNNEEIIGEQCLSN